MTDTKMRVLPTEDWNSSLSHVIGDMKGMPLNVHKLLANNPPLLLQSVDELASNGALGLELPEKLDAHIGQEAVLDLIALHSMYVMLGNMLNTREVELDRHVANALPDSVNRENIEGRR